MPDLVPKTIGKMIGNIKEDTSKRAFVKKSSPAQSQMARASKIKLIDLQTSC
jgi:hypothetical protein